MLKIAWSIDARIAYYMCRRFILHKAILHSELTKLISLFPMDILNVDQCVLSFIENGTEDQLRVFFVYPILIYSYYTFGSRFLRLLLLNYLQNQKRILEFYNML